MKLAQNLDAIESMGLPSLKYSTFKQSTVGEALTGILPYIFGAAGIILIINIISSGLKMMTSKGDPKVMQAAQTKLTTSIIGVVVLFISFFVVRLIMQFLGVNAVLFT